jgi:hypothetical protein
VIKSGKKYLILIHSPLSILVNIPTIGIRAGPLETIKSLEGRSWSALRMERQCLMVRIMPSGIEE